MIRQTGSKLFLIICLLSMIAYCLPWTTELALSGYDLAEWTTLFPPLRGTIPPLLPALLIRLQLPIILLLIMGAITDRRIQIVILFAGCLALMPPLEFVTTSGDVNYQQQFILAVFTAIMGGTRIARRFKPLVEHAIQLGLILMGLISVVIGYQQSLEVIQQFAPTAEPALGVALLIVLYVFLALNKTRQWLLPRFA